MNVFLRFARYLAPHRLRIGLVLLFTALFVLANTAARVHFHIRFIFRPKPPGLSGLT